MLLKNVLGFLIIISNIVGILLIFMNTTITKFASRKTNSSSSDIKISSEHQNEQKIKDDLLKDIDLSELDDLNLDDFD